jgi:hypothetical protein
MSLQPNQLAAAERKEVGAALPTMPAMFAERLIPPKNVIHCVLECNAAMKEGEI